MESADKDSKPEKEEDLSKLLDSCLDDFNKTMPKASAASKQNTTAGATAASNAPSGASDASGLEATWTEEFKQFNKMMETYMDDEGEVGDMKKWMESLSGGQNTPFDSDEFARTFTDTLKELTEQAQNIPETNPEDLANLLGGLDLGGASGGGGDQLSDVMPLMQNVMQKLMSKELLYPSIKEIVEKYPDWLKEKQPTLSQSDYDNYKKQYDLMLKVCEEFEKETVDTEASKKEQFEKVLQLMQQIQNYGNPPKELVSSVGSVPLDEQGNLQIPGLPQQCSVM
ncbi:peroxisomal biogenesis factor 19 [Parasteatoda tepidariorum]|uniref:peroxisomal biogenesis factor 19 n=1 Tax=Parasteatoda tepidariorum TaxID=114398 RepID=UPI00077FC582|nr:peroxisomal biogenesis factor 19 [Parasteatoda tepidariorum]XP_015916181.1 peroxisomal biogenesis factor 19 [Parasteatoda tepidariorum]XP_042902259.1 peroxisomal biogenesis factor 19 [Parasteatoda tepidariorum]